MQIRMQNSEALTREQNDDFLKGTEGVSFVGEKKKEVYAWVERVLVSQEFLQQDKKLRGAVRAYVEKMTGLSSAQVTRLIRLFRKTGGVEAKAYRRRSFMRIYTDVDLAMLAEVDRAHEWLSGPATRRILEREYTCFGKQEYVRLAKISNGHLYNLRASAGYRKLVAVYKPTQATAVSIGERRRPEPEGRAGYLRGDTVHQGDWEGAKGGYHINAVDVVTQWQVVGCASRISEAYLQPVLEAILHQFPFRILGFHSDNGSEYINRDVARLLEKLLIEFTKSRANRSQDNALVEGKNGAVVRKLMGYGHTAGEHAEAIREVLCAALEPVSEFSPTLRLCHGEPGRARQTPAPIQDRGLSDAVGETEIAGEGRAISQAGCEFGGVGTEGAGHERHRVCAQDGRRQVAAAAAMQSTVSASAVFPIGEPWGRGND